MAGTSGAGASGCGFAANDEITLSWIVDGRGFAQATEQINADYPGVLVRDGYVVYDHYDKATHQACLAHLNRI